MSNKEKKVIKVKKGSKKLRKQKRLISILVVVFIIVSGLQIQSAIANKKNEVVYDLYSSLSFDTPIKQTLAILTLEQNGGEKLFNNQNNTIEYSDIKNYNSDLHQRYVNFHNLNKDLLESEVIWRVNANFDYDFYSNIRYISEVSAYTQVLNKNIALTSDYEPNDLVKMDKVTNEFYVRKEVNEAFNEMLEAVNKEDLKLEVLSAYRSYSSIKESFNNYIKENNEEKAYSALLAAGHDDHQTGLSIDVSDKTESNFSDSDTYFWLKDNAHRFGFIFRNDNGNDITGFPVEKNHLRFVGKDIAIDMYEKNIMLLEEYLDKHGA